jgi:TRAP-type C4-dicarboxylate transport system permease small subunit
MDISMTRAPAHGLSDLYRIYRRTMEVLAAGALALIVIILTAQIVYRYFLSGSLIWAEELSRCLLVWICFLFAGIAYQRGEMASVDFFTRILPARWRLAAMLPALAGTLIFLAFLTYYGAIYAMQNRMQILPGVSVPWRALTGSAGGFSIFWVYISIPIGLGILFLHVAGTAIRIVGGLLADAPSAEREP